MDAGASPAVPAHADVLAGVIVRPPRLAWDGERYTGARLQAAAAEAATALPGVVRVVIERDFVGIVAQTPDFAQNAKARLRVAWDDAPGRRRAPPEPAAGAAADRTGLERTYRWPAAAGRAAAAGWAVAWHHGDALTVWAACESPEALRQELAALLGLPEARIELRHNGLPASAQAFDAAADAALLSRAVGKPVRVEAQGGDAGAGSSLLTMHVRAAVGPDGSVEQFEVDSNAAPSARPSLARLLARGVAGQPRSSAAAGVSPYAFPEQRVTRPEAMALGPRSLHPDNTVAAHVFATESFVDETARAAAADPVEFRLRQMDDARGAALVRSVGEQAAGGQRARGRAAGLRRGTGFAYASALDETTQPPTRTWTAWAVDVAVDSSGSVDIERVVVGHDAEQLRPMASEAVWIEGQVQDAAHRLLEAPSFDDWGVAAAAAPAPQAKAPSVDVVRPAHALAPAGALAWSETATLPAAAALANAIFDATGVRFREPPFNGPQVQARLGEPAAPGPKRALAWLGGLAAVAAGMLATVLPWRSAIAPSSPPDPSLYSAAAIERGRLVAAAGDCVVCHTAPGGRPNAGGLALETPFGTIYSTNLTPDVQTGIGSWSYAAFERAMREGVHRDGRRLYPAFPYTAFAKTSDADLQALYAYLMTQPAVEAKPPETRLAFPYNVRGLLGGWNALFHDSKPYQADASRSAEWNRGAYLVQGLGHCGACHTPRNAMGAEKRDAFLAGGVAEGWDAPALTGLSKAPLPWTHSDLVDYLRTGVSARHGVAAGPMAPVLHEMRQLPDSDIRAIATYLVSLNAAPPDEAAIGAQLQVLEARAAPDDRLDGPGARIFEGACAACHQTPGGPTLFGSKVSLALNTNLHSDRPDNLVQVILRGIPDPAHENLGYMQGFADSLDDAQIEELAHYLRRRFAPGKPAWKDVGKTAARIRAEHAAEDH